VSDFTQDASLTGLYNQGNALARLGRYPEAIERYEQVLQEDPGQQEAAFNKALLEKLLEQQNQQEQAEQEQQDQQQQQQSQESQTSDSDQQQEQGEQEDEQQQSEQKPEESEQQSDDENAEESEAEEDTAERDEKQEALEQWLRRVPDDPGGLLRRKFQHETKQRLRQGDYSNRQDEQVW
jgi:Ca-activated chloride channel family protein